MTQDYKVTLRDIVELFYQSPFKIFNINSIDGETLVKPFGYFISLGITTSLESLRMIRDYISKSDYGFEARLVEIKSVRSEKYGDYLNTLLSTPEDEIKKYPTDPVPGVKVLGKEETVKLLETLSEEIQSGDFRRSPLRQKLYEVLEKIGDDWGSKSILFKDDSPSVYHQYVNYKDTGEAEYRIGIYATKL